MIELQKAILQTLAYADVFDYPLTSEELYRFLIYDKHLSFTSFKKVLSLMNADLKLIDADKKFFFITGRREIVNLRKKRGRWSKKKLEIAQKVANWLRFIPWIKMVGITGALAMGNADENDDIDILIVSAKDRLWLTRLFTAVLVELLGQRRRPGQNDVRDKICLNMFLDEDHLGLPKKEQDLFSAHEVVQMKKLWDRDNTYQKFLWENRWVRKYLPNTLITTNVNTNYHEKISVNSCFYSCLLVLERLVKKLQLWYMKKRRTTEVVSNGVLRFHPQDARKWVLTRYKNLLK